MQLIWNSDQAHSSSTIYADAASCDVRSRLSATDSENGTPIGQDSAQQPNVRYTADTAAWSTVQQSTSYNKVNRSRGAAPTQMHYTADILYTQFTSQNSI